MRLNAWLNECRPAIRVIMMRAKADRIGKSKDEHNKRAPGQALFLKMRGR